MLIAAITVIFMICLWGVISGFFSLNALKEDRREEQYDSIFKSEKASYLMLRKYFDEIEERIEMLQKESKIPTEDIINAQKGIAKVVINRNKENADAIKIIGRGNYAGNFVCIRNNPFKQQTKS